MPNPTLFKRGLPWALALTIAGTVFAIVPIGEAWSAACEARVESLALLVIGSVGCWFLIESAAYAYLFSRFNTPLSFREARSLRGLTYLLTPIHLSLGKAAVVLRLHTTKHVPLLEGASSIVWYQTIDGLVLASLTLAGLTLIPASLETSNARFVAVAIIALLAIHLLLLRSDKPRLALLDRARRMSVHKAQRTTRFEDVFVIVVAKLAYHLVTVAVFYFGLEAFGIEIPFALALATTPVIQAIGGLPITPGGLGTQQAAMLYFFAGHGSEAAIVAFGFSVPIAIMAARGLLGLAYLPDLRDRFSRLADAR